MPDKKSASSSATIHGEDMDVEVLSPNIVTIVSLLMLQECLANLTSGVTFAYAAYPKLFQIQ